MRYQFGNGVDAGAGEGGYEITTVKGFERRKRKMRFERDKAAETTDRRKSGNAPAYAEPIKAPGAYEQRHQRRRG